MDEPGLICAYSLDGKGGGRQLGWPEVRSWRGDQGLIWVHLDYSAPAARQWLQEESGVDEVVQEVLVAEETRPRSATMGNGLLMLLRGVNFNPGADPEDMVSLRIWMEPKKIVSSRKRTLASVTDLREAIEKGQGPCSAAEFLVDISDRLAARMASVIEGIYDQVDELEDEVLIDQSQELRSRLSSIRRQIIALRRYLAPQREAMARLQMERITWLGDLERIRLREAADRITRYVEDLDEARDRAGVVHEELTARLSEQMNQRMYVLSLVAGVFLPLGFLTGLLGINVGGIPGAESSWGFPIFVTILCGVVATQVYIFYKKRWL